MQQNRHSPKHKKRRTKKSGRVLGRSLGLILVIVSVCGGFVWLWRQLDTRPTQVPVASAATGSSRSHTGTATSVTYGTVDNIHSPGSAWPYRDTDGSKPVRDIPVTLQNPELPAGCEATAAAMLLYAYGYEVDKLAFAHALPTSHFEVYQDRTYAAHPDEAYIGDPFTASGIGAFARVTAQTMQTLIDAVQGPHRAVDLTGAQEDALLAYIDRGIPVCIWSTIGMLGLVDVGGWYIKRGDTYTDEYFRWPGNEHCMVLTAYDDQTVTVHDPLRGRRTYNRRVFFQRYVEVGRYAVVLEPRS